MRCTKAGWLGDIHLLVWALVHSDVWDNLLLECYDIGQLLRAEVLEAVAIEVYHLEQGIG